MDGRSVKGSTLLKSLYVVSVIPLVLETRKATDANSGPIRNANALEH